MTKAERAEVANRVIELMASCGRRFLRHEDRVARFEVDERGQIVFIDHYTQRRIYVRQPYFRRGFTGGGTLRNLVKELAGFIASGRPIAGSFFGPWPDWYCGGDLWGYGHDVMEQLRADLARECSAAIDSPSMAGDE